MAKIKQSVCWWCYARGTIPARDLIREVAEIGYAGIELVGQEHWPLIREHGLTIASIGGHGSIVDGLNRRDQHARIEQELRASIRLAEEWGIPNLICFSGSRASLDDATGAEITAEGLRKVAPMAEQAGVTLILELLNSKVDHPDYQCDHTAWGVEVCRMVDSPRVKLLYDIYHMQIMEGDIIRTIHDNHTWFGHYHTAGNPGRHDLDAHQELYYPPIMQTIVDTGYDGFVGQEFIPKGEPIAALRTAFEICDVGSQS
jgi:hydroxypyruvate isomerase